MDNVYGWLLVVFVFVVMWTCGCGPAGTGGFVSDVDGGGADGLVGADARPPASPLAEGGAPPDQLGACAGYVDPAIAGCWYMGDVGASCFETCASHGGFDVVSAPHLGHAIALHFFPLALVLGTTGAGAIYAFEWITPSGDTVATANANGRVPDPRIRMVNGRLACACAR